MEIQTQNNGWEQLNISNAQQIDGNTMELFLNLLTTHLKRKDRNLQEIQRLTTADKKLAKLVEKIPQLISNQNIEIIPFKTTYQSTLITDEEVTQLAKVAFHNCYANIDLTEDQESLAKEICFEIIYAVPFIFKQLGYQLSKISEKSFVNGYMAEKLARAIHARYQDMMIKSRSKQNESNLFDLMYLSTASKEYIEKEFDQLPEEIKQSNIDNAYHIPTKLLSIGLQIQKAKFPDDAPLLFLSDTDIETMAVVEHQRWCWEKRMNGYTYGPERDDVKKMHNCLVLYDQLTEFEKEKDRQLVRMIPALIKDIGFEAVGIEPKITDQLTYFPKAKTKITEVKLVAEKLNDAINRFFGDKQLPIPEVIAKYLKELNEGAGEIAGAFSSAISVQRTYLPSPLMVHECLPDSFLLYKPKDGVGGDFYFVAKKFGAVIWVCADCTGHGISAGLLTAICYNYIDQAVNELNITDPAAIIAHVMPKVENLMRRSDGNMENKSGMELAVCTFYQQAQILFYAGLNRPLYYITNNQLTELDAARYRESFETIAINLKTQIIQLKPNDIIYLTSDGFIDQFGGTRNPLGERFKNKQFKELLDKIHNQSMIQQRETLNQTIEKWRQEANQDQTDDILVMGVKF